MRSAALVLVALLASACDTDSLCGTSQVPDRPKDAGPDASTCPAPGTGCTSVACSGRCFEVCTGSVSAATASDGCQARGQCLATVDTGDVAVCLGIALASTPGGTAWVGMVQAQSATTLGDNWSWKCTGAAATPWWTPGEPNDAEATAGVEDGEEQCTWIIAGNGLMVDDSCTASNQFICEVPR